jgi:3-hydroxymyristoyl/3-hydroxydecanoyl-(acyl carrier protein) dehydratase
MRYVLIDRILAVTPGRALSAMKNVSASDDLVRHYAGRGSALPASMVLEAMAQAAGLLAVATSDAAVQPVLAKVQPCVSRAETVPGDQLRIDAVLEDVRAEGCRARVAAAAGGRPVAEATIYLGFVALDSGRAAVLRAALAESFPGWFDRLRHAEASQ